MPIGVYVHGCQTCCHMQALVQRLALEDNPIDDFHQDLWPLEEGEIELEGARCCHFSS